jgi:L-ribulokinase
MFAFLAAGTFRSIDEAQAALAPAYVTVEPDAGDVAVYDGLYARFRDAYFKLSNFKPDAGRDARRDAP